MDKKIKDLSFFSCLSSTFLQNIQPGLLSALSAAGGRGRGGTGAGRWTTLTSAVTSQRRLSERLMNNRSVFTLLIAEMVIRRLKMMVICQLEMILTKNIQSTSHCVSVETDQSRGEDKMISTKTFKSTSSHSVSGEPVQSRPAIVHCFHSCLWSLKRESNTSVKSISFN